MVANSSTGGVPIIAATQIGAGQMIVTATASSAAINNSVGGINVGFGANSGPYSGHNFAAAPAADLKFVTDLISWDTAHPSEVKNSHQSSQSRSSLGPAVTPIWSYGNSPPARPSARPARPSTGIMSSRAARTASCTPSTPPPAPTSWEQARPTPASMISSTASPMTRSGTAAAGAFPAVSRQLQPDRPLHLRAHRRRRFNGQSLVFTEDAAGSRVRRRRHHGQALRHGTQRRTAGFQSERHAAALQCPTGPAPSPTYYGGRIYAGQADGNLYVYDFRRAGSAHAGIRYQFTGSEPVLAAPTVGIVRDKVLNTQVDDIVAALSTNMGVYTVMLGARHDYLTDTARRPHPAPAEVATGSQFTIDAGAPSYFYTEPGAAPLFPTSAVSPYTLPNYLGNYDVAFTATPANYLNRAEFTANPAVVAGYTVGTSQAAISAPALGSNGSFYYTVNLPTSVGTDSTLVCAHDVRAATFPTPTNRINWRFRLPYGSEAGFTDADGIGYSPLNGFRFQGAPVVDGRGNVFALAVNTSTTPTQTAVLCFNGTQAVSVQAVPPAAVPTGDTVSITGMTQPLPGGTTDEFGGSPLQTIGAALQYSATPDINGDTTLTNFGTSTTTVGNLAISPNVSEPQPVIGQLLR